MTRDPDLSAKSAVTVPMRVTPKSDDETPDSAAEPTPLPEGPETVERPTVLDEPSDADKPAATAQPEILTKPAGLDLASVVAGSLDAGSLDADEPTVIDESVVDEPLDVDQPTAVDEPAVDEPLAVDGALAVDEPAAGEPMSSGEPAGSTGSAETAVPDQTAFDPEASPAVTPSETVPIPGARPAPSRTRAGGIGVALVLVAAGLLFTTSAATARGTQLRSEHADLASLIAAEDLRVKTRTQRLDALTKQVRQEAMANTQSSKAIKALEQRSAAVIMAAGLLPMTGPGLTVTLDDAPRDVPVPAQAGPDDLVVHQQDVQAVVNALWAGGAEAMMLQDQRVISTSAVRCVGNTLILQGRVYSPPYRITVIGNVKKMQASLDSSPQIAYYLQYVASLRLGWEVKRSDRLSLPAYAGSLALTHARVPGSSTSSAGPASSSS